MLYGRQANWLAVVGLTSNDCLVSTNRTVNQAVCSFVSLNTGLVTTSSVFFQMAYTTQITWIIWSSLTGN